MVVNGATKYGDMKHFDEHLAAFRAKGFDVSYEYLHNQNLVALQVRFYLLFTALLTLTILYGSIFDAGPCCTHCACPPGGRC
jgi:hypothetical protein